MKKSLLDEAEEVSDAFRELGKCLFEPIEPFVKKCCDLLKFVSDRIFKD